MVAISLSSMDKRHNPEEVASAIRPQSWGAETGSNIKKAPIVALNKGREVYYSKIQS
jgi:hypothetical protein